MMEIYGKECEGINVTLPTEEIETTLRKYPNTVLYYSEHENKFVDKNKRGDTHDEENISAGSHNLDGPLPRRLRMHRQRHNKD
ncbi:hypothetical protein [Methanosarcina barkeri]|uniref:hypothetical protein n=1 Tax=Methanosarcina barkeri TaxID=2208 RepID=UPI0000386525|nr:hypothetical protein [Methanosarcina barkeri]